MSILSAGTFFGALFAFPMGDMVGRKWGIVASCMIFSFGVGLQLDTHWPTFIVGRVIAGIGVVCRVFCCKPCAILWLPSFFRGSSHVWSPCINQRYKKKKVTLLLCLSDLWLSQSYSAPLKNCGVSLSDFISLQVSLSCHLVFSSFCWCFQLVTSFFFWKTVTVGALLSAVVLNSTQNRPDHSAWRVCCFYHMQKILLRV